MMYANYFNKQPKKNSNVLRFKPPGFKYTIDFPFPGRTLAVCARCKKNYKTREHCRTKECHTTLPWTETYLCITLDASCTDLDGQILDGPFIAQPAPTTSFQYAGLIESNTPSCGPCKEKNYTRTYCRTNKKHRTLPWASVYFILTHRADAMIPPPEDGFSSHAGASSHGHPSNVQEMVSGSASGSPSSKRRKVKSSHDKKLNDDKTQDDDDGEANDESEKTDPKGRNENDKDTNDEANEEGSESSNDGKNDKQNEEEIKKKMELEAAKIFDVVHPSRTFLAAVSVHKCKIEWLEYDASQQQGTQSRRDDTNHKAQDEANPSYPQYPMMPPPMGMNMMMNPYMPPHPHMMVNEQGNNGGQGDGGNGSGDGVVSPENRGDGSNRNPNDSHGNWSMPPPSSYPMQQEMMYQSQMGFAYGFPPPWRGPPMEHHMMTPYDTQAAPMMHQMGWGGGNFYSGSPMPPHQQQQQIFSPGVGSGEMPQSYQGEKTTRKPMKNSDDKSPSKESSKDSKSKEEKKK